MNKKNSIIIFVFIVIIFIFYKINIDLKQSKLVLNKYDAALICLNNKDYKNAIKNFNYVKENLMSNTFNIKCNNEQYEIKIRSYYYIADCYAAIKMYDKANDAYRIAYSIDMKKTWHKRNMQSTDYLKRMIAQEICKEYDAALESINLGLCCKPCYAKQELMYNKIYVLEKSGNWSKAYKALLEYKKIYHADIKILKEEKFLFTRYMQI